jgi:hypothetical protein
MMTTADVTTPACPLIHVADRLTRWAVRLGFGCVMSVCPGGSSERINQAFDPADAIWQR